MNLENKKQVAIIALAVGLGFVAAFLTSQYIQSTIRNETKLLAQQYDKKKSAILNEVELMKKELNRIGNKQAAIIKKQQQIQQMKQQVVTAAPSQDQQDTKKVIQMNSFAIRTPPDKRAFTIMIDSLSAIGGLINPGDFVDIIGQLEMPVQEGSEDTEEITTVLFQNIQILAVGTNFKPIENETPTYEAQQSARTLTVTLALTPQEASLLAFAQTNGQLKLSLRSPTDQDTEVLQVASWEELSDFVLENQGTDLFVPKKQATISPVTGSQVDEVKPFIQIFRGGRRDL
jgi:pilus assembly protein CpaB